MASRVESSSSIGPTFLNIERASSRFVAERQKLEDGLRDKVRDNPSGKAADEPEQRCDYPIHPLSQPGATARPAAPI